MFTCKKFDFSVKFTFNYGSFYEESEPETTSDSFSKNDLHASYTLPIMFVYHPAHITPNVYISQSTFYII